MVATGAVTSTSVRVWARGSQPGPHRLVIEPEGAAAIAVDIALPDGASDRTGAWTYPDDFPNAVPLAAMTAHSFRVVHRDAAVVVERLVTRHRSEREAMWRMRRIGRGREATLADASDSAATSSASMATGARS